jgi:phosphoribosylformylglycinamidine synthase
VYLDPYRGAQLAVAEAARNVACVGAHPIGVTNCLNFGNPEKPDVMWQFVRAVEGMGDACRALGIPITGGNVSLYNETDGRAVLPTPVIGVVGLIDDARSVVRRTFQQSGDAVLLLGDGHAELGGSEYLQVAHRLTCGVPPALDLAREAALQRILVDGIAGGLIRSAHDCSEGGIAVTLAECCFETGVGVDVQLPPVASGAVSFNDIATLFGESASRAVVSTAAENVDLILALAQAAEVPARRIGTVGGDRIRIAIESVVVDELVADAERIWSTALDEHFESSRAIA